MVRQCLWFARPFVLAITLMGVFSCGGASDTGPSDTGSSGQVGISVAVNTPANYLVTVTGGTALRYGVAATFGSTYGGTACGYQWFLNGSALPGAFAPTLTVTPAIGSAWPYGSNLIQLSVTDVNGIVYSGQLPVNVGN